MFLVNKLLADQDQKTSLAALYVRFCAALARRILAFMVQQDVYSSSLLPLCSLAEQPPCVIAMAVVPLVECLMMSQS